MGAVEGDAVAWARDPDRRFEGNCIRRMRRDHDFRRGLLSDAIESLLAGEAALGREILRDFINARLGHDWFSGAGGEDGHSCEVAAPDVWAEGESDSRESVQYYCVFAGV